MSGHRCIAGKDCRNRADIDGRRVAAPTEKPGTLCPPCRDRITRAIRELPADWAELRDALGEHATNTGQKIRSSPTPAIPISTRKEALMAAIVDMADRAAAIVSDQLHTDQPATYHGRGFPTYPERTLRKAIAITEPNIHLLAAAPPEPALTWKKPRRCDTHARLIAFAEAEKSEYQMRVAYAAAGDCIECNGWGDWGQERELVEMSGLKIGLELVELHNQARAELGHTRLREQQTMPCPDCGGRVFRNDGESIVVCEEDPKHTRTEREFKVLTGLELEERLSMAHHKYWLAEAYWRLDRVRGVVEILDKTPNIDSDPRAGLIILDHLKQILNEGAPDESGKPIPHQSPKQRATGTDKYSALERQVDEDNWNWRNEPRYEPPKPKPRKTPEIKDPIHPGSLTLLTDIDENAVINSAARCIHCNLIHPPGECP